MRRWIALGLGLLAIAAVGVLSWAVFDGGDGDVADEPIRPPAPATATELRSRTDLLPPRVVVDPASARPEDGLILLSPRPGANGAKRLSGQQQGPLLVDGRGRVRWFESLPRAATDVRVQRYRGQPVLTWWQGTMPELGVGSGEAVIVDQTYRTIATVRAGDGLSMDLHEFRLTPRGTALVTIYDRARRDLRAIGGARDAQITEGIVQEIDVQTGKVLFEWHSLDEVDPAESVMPVPESSADSYDYFHINSVEEDGDDRLLISARNTSTIYEVDKRSGKVLWRLGGKRGDFELGEGAEFALQHDARYAGRGLVRLFDNGDNRPDQPPVPSSAKLLRLDRQAGTATLVRRDVHPDALAAQSQGNVQALSGGRLLVGWGSAGRFSLLAADGGLLVDGRLPSGYDSYRAYLDEWTGRPTTRPRVAVAADEGRVTVFASWNGATEVARWQVLTGPDPDALAAVGAPAPWAGLETAIAVSTDAPYVAVRALDESGATLARSLVARVP